MKKLVFTDLDGTLLDLETYSADLVIRSVEKLKNAGVSVIFCSSKTWAEQEYYLDQLDLNEPVIVENGSGIFLPIEFDIAFQNQVQKLHKIHDHNVMVLGKSYDEVLQIVEENAKRYIPDLKYYANQTIDSLSEMTGLDLEAAKKAKSRDFSETLFNVKQSTTAYKNFSNALHSYGFQCMPGSRYITVTGIESNKGRAVSMLIETYKSRYAEVISFGIGDSRNDQEMLEVVDHPYLVQRPDQTWADITVDNITKVAEVGPEGWNIMTAEILSD